MNKTTLNDTLKQWKKHCETVQNSTTINVAESEKDKLARIKKVRSDYAAFVDYYFPHYTVNPETGKTTPCADFHIKAAN